MSALNDNRFRKSTALILFKKFGFMQILLWTSAVLMIPFISLSAFADSVKTKDGSMINGQIINLAGGKLLIQTSFAGEITIPVEQIFEIECAEAKPIHLSDGSVIQGTIKAVEPGKLEVTRKEDQSKFSASPSQIIAINPPAPPTPTPAKWQGKVVGTLAVTGGNSETQAYGLTAEAMRRTEQDRITLKGGYYYSKDDSKTTRDDEYLSGKYDYFFTKALFGYLNSRLDRDAIKDLELRSTGGAGLGYQFLETDIYNLFGEAGISFVDENFRKSVDDTTYAAARAAAHFGWWLIPKRLQFEQNGEFLVSVADTDDWLAISESIVSWHWTNQWSLDGSVRLEYDNTPATGRKNTDTKYTLGIGYSF